MARTIRITPEGHETRDGHTARSERRPVTRTRRQGTRRDVIAAVLADVEADALVGIR